MSFPQRMLLLDIETTGLNRIQDHIVSLGMTYTDSNAQLKTDYWFLSAPNEEAALLERFMTLLTQFDVLFSYAGKSFEFPFILSRLEYHHINSDPFLRLKLIDMKKTLHHFASNRTELEQLFHYERQSQTTGYHIIHLYRTYRATQMDIYKHCILMHQKDELNSLLYLWELYMTLSESTKWHFESQSCTNQEATYTFSASNPFKHSFSGATSLGLHFSYQEGETALTLTIPLLKGELTHYIEPLKDYYYIDAQKQLIHKSLAQFIPTSQKRKALREECVITKEGVFIPIFTKYKLTLPIWFNAQQQFYVEYSDLLPALLQEQVFHLFFTHK